MQPGVTIVISPLLSLIQDQIITLNLKFGVPSTFLNSQQTTSQAYVVLQELRQGFYLSRLSLFSGTETFRFKSEAKTWFSSVLTSLLVTTLFLLRLLDRYSIL